MWSGVVKYKMKSCNEARNVSNDGEDDAYDTLPGHNHFLVLPWPEERRNRCRLVRNSENWICTDWTDTRQTSHNHPSFKSKSFSVCNILFLTATLLIPCCKLVQISREMKLRAGPFDHKQEVCGALHHHPFPPLLICHDLSHTSCVTWKTVRILENT